MRQFHNQRTQPVSGGSFSTVAVDASRSATGHALLGVNLDGAVLDPFSEPEDGDPVELLAATEYSCLAWTNDGLAAFVVVGQSVSVEDLCLRLLDRCRSIEQIGDRLMDMRLHHATIVAVDRTEIRGWQADARALHCLLPMDGLLNVAAGHSSTHSLPNDGWHLEKLERLRKRSLLRVEEIDAALASASMGTTTSYTAVVEPARKGLRLRCNTPAQLLARKSA